MTGRPDRICARFSFYSVRTALKVMSFLTCATQVADWKAPAYLDLCLLKSFVQAAVSTFELSFRKNEFVTGRPDTICARPGFYSVVIALKAMSFPTCAPQVSDWKILAYLDFFLLSLSLGDTSLREIFLPAPSVNSFSRPPLFLLLCSFPLSWTKINRVEVR